MAGAGEFKIYFACGLCRKHVNFACNDQLFTVASQEKYKSYGHEWIESVSCVSVARLENEMKQVPDGWRDLMPG